MADDSKKYRPLKGGIQGQVESLSSASGTIGCLAETNRPGEPRRIVLLSVAHLFYAGRGVTALGPITQPGDRACQPDACSKCSRCCSDDVGRALRGEFSASVDAAIATLYAGTRYLREIEEIGPIRGDHVITEAEAHSRTRRFRVRKRGIRTRLTEGEVRLLDFAARTRGLDDSFRRVATQLILIQPRTLVQAPITAIQANGVIRVATAQFQTLGVNENHVIEITGPTRNRNLYRVNAVQSQTEIVASDPLNEGHPATLIAETQPVFTPLSRFVFLLNGPNGFEAPGIGANNQGLQPFDMVEIRNSPSNDGIYQVQPLNGSAILQDGIAVYEKLSEELNNGAEARGVLFIRVREPQFCDAADSGAAIVNDASEVVGLLAGKAEDARRPDLRGYGFATPIRQITTNLDISCSWRSARTSMGVGSGMILWKQLRTRLIERSAGQLNLAFYGQLRTRSFCLPSSAVLPATRLRQSQPTWPCNRRR
ncbi:hypothetical protein BH18ACI4_BH18ACI4_16550 [soil metagenome]